MPILPPASALRPFLSTPSARRATALQFAPGTVHLISIHALREEGDTNGLYCKEG